MAQHNMAQHKTAQHNTQRTLLAAVDYSDLASLVVDHAVAEIQHVGAGELHFLHVGKDREEVDPGASRDQLANWLGAALAGKALPPSISVIGHVANGNTAHVIVQTASDLLADLVVVGTRGRTGVQRALLGSTSESVIRHCGCPVLVVRPRGYEHAVPEIEPPCPRCVAARLSSRGSIYWCEQHQERHGRRHTYYDPRSQTWVSERLVL
jgi:nucleotide-binding universal stress UspA family protein